jgi:hypothetical protein
MGVPWTRLEVFDASVSAYRLRRAGPADLLLPGQGLWVHVTADAVWTLAV